PQVVALFLAEGLMLGLLGSVLGVALGTLMARITLGVVARTLTELYLVMQATRVYLDPATYGVGLALGIGMSLLSAVAPAIEASHTPPNVTVRQGILIEAQHLPVGKWALLGFALLALSAGTAFWTLAERHPLGGFGSAFLLL